MLFCLTANYTHKAPDAMRENPNTNRREAVEKMVAAAGGKLVEMYGTMAEGPGAMVIFDADPVAGNDAEASDADFLKHARLCPPRYGHASPSRAGRTWPLAGP